MTHHFNNFTKQYKLDKTIRVELQPIGNTLEYIKNGGFISKDTIRANNYLRAKSIIDNYHKEFINKTLSASDILPITDNGNKNSLSEYYKYCSNNDPDAKKNLKSTQNALRITISKTLINSTEYNNLFKLPKKKLFTQILPNFVTNEEDRNLILGFSNFVTYFSGFNQNRANLYTSEEKSTAIAYRLINENLPKFIDNIRIFKEIQEEFKAPDWFKALESDFSTILNGKNVSELFDLSYYNHLLTQKGIDAYNSIIGGYTKEDTQQKIKGLNEYINLYNQQHQNEKLPKFKMLFKQILSDRESISWLPEKFDDDNDVLTAVKNCYDDLSKNILGNNALKTLLTSLSDYNLEGIFINKIYISGISKSLCGDWHIIPDAILKQLRCENSKSGKESEDKYEERILKNYKTTDSFSIHRINTCLSELYTEKGYLIQDYFASLGKKADSQKNLFEIINDAYNDAGNLLNAPYPQSKNLSNDDDSIAKIKTLLDAIKDLQCFVKPLLGKGDESNKDERFATEINALWAELDTITPLYAKVQAYMTKKPFSQEKIRVYFENNGTFLNGWVDSKTATSDNGTQYGGYIFRKKNTIGEYDYYLGISSNAKLFRDKKILGNDGTFERLNYYQIKTDTIFGNSYISNYNEDTNSLKAALENYANSHNIDGKYIFENGETIPHYLKRVQSADNSYYNAMLCDTICQASYNNLQSNILKTLASFNRLDSAIALSKRSDIDLISLYDEINKLPNKSFSYFPVATSEIEEAMNSAKKKLFLFKLTNKDLSYAENFTNGNRKKRGRENLHTLYLKAILNGGNGIFDLGTGSIYFRKKSITCHYPTHPANTPIKNKNPHNDKSESIFNYDLIKNHRYTIDKFLFHLSFTINYMESNKNDINPMVNEYLHDANDIHIIGIDRGERNLLYLCIIDLNGNIIKHKQLSLNEIKNIYNGKEFPTDYHKLLDTREGENMDSRKNWKTIEGIKDLKEGYLSQVIHKISQLMVEYHAIVVLEDLNMGFMRGRQKVEKSVYQQFEHKLITKLNYLVDKQTDANQPGGVLNGYQLTNKFESFRELGKQKQTGFLFYIPAWNTSKIDPTTGFVNLFTIRYENIKNAKEFFGKFNSIRYNTDKNRFEFDFDYTEFNAKAVGTRTKWTICTDGERIRTYRKEELNNNYCYEEVNLTDEFKKFFSKNGIDLNCDLKEAICTRLNGKEYEEFISLFRLTLQMRNSNPITGDDYIISPAIGNNGTCFDSRKCDDSLPKDADANGAYNIARKGLMMIRQLKASDNPTKPKFDLSNKAWLNFAQQSASKHE